MKKFKNEVSALTHQVDLHKIQKEDVERDKARVVKEKKELEDKLAELTKLHEVVKIIASAERDVEKVQELPDRDAASSSTDQILTQESSMLSPVAKQLKWATHVRRTQPPQQQAETFYQAYRVILVNEDTYKQKITQLKEDIKRSERNNEEHEHLKKKSLTLIERNKALRTQVQKLQA